MSEMFQNALAGLIVAGAVGYLLLRLWRLVRGSSQGRCGGCSACQLPQGRSAGKFAKLTAWIRTIRARGFSR